MLVTHKYTYYRKYVSFRGGDPSLKSGALQLQILKSLKRMPWHPFKAPGLQTVKSVTSTDAPRSGSNIIKSVKSTDVLVGLKVLKGTPGARLSFSEYKHYFCSRQPLGDREVLLNQSRAFSCSAQRISYVLTLA